jgi:hypothetical protein
LCCRIGRLAGHTVTASFGKRIYTRPKDAPVAWRKGIDITPLLRRVVFVGEAAQF